MTAKAGEPLRPAHRRVRPAGPTQGPGAGRGGPARFSPSGGSGLRGAVELQPAVEVEDEDEVGAGALASHIVPLAVFAGACCVHPRRIRSGPRRSSAISVSIGWFIRDSCSWVVGEEVDRGADRGVALGVLVLRRAADGAVVGGGSVFVGSMMVATGSWLSPGPMTSLRVGAAGMGAPGPRRDHLSSKMT